MPTALIARGRPPSGSTPESTRRGLFGQWTPKLGRAVVARSLAVLLAVCGADSTKGVGEDSQDRCSDGVDNDSDGLVDCEDPRCSVFTYCAPADGDADGDTDSDCPDVLSFCDGECVDLRNNKEHCGRCGWTCTRGECDGGDCSCSEPYPDLCENGLDRRCVDLAVNVDNCGGCGRLCRGGHCVEGECVCYPETPDPCFSQLRTFCYDFNSDPVHCGDCEAGCDEGESCTGGVCVAPQ